jgi:Ca2+-binding RTX toxin-like protein
LLAGPDLIFGGSGRDFVRAGRGDETIRGGPQGDVLHGALGADTIYAGAGPDTIFGNAGSDVIFGGKLGDRIRDGLGADTIYGGLGPDTVYLQKDGTSDTVTCGPGHDVVWGASSENIVAADCEEVHVVSSCGCLLLFARPSSASEPVYANEPQLARTRLPFLWS